MERIRKLYIQFHKPMENIVYPVFLFLYPLVMIFQGLDVSDSTYSLGNYLYFDRMEGMWVVSTYLSNVIGWLLTLLPFGTTLIGMKLYTGLFISGLALLCYYRLKEHLSPLSAFVGEVIAIGFCWIPSTILYNYISYFLFALGLLLLYEGIIREQDKYYFIAGIVLGLNVFVRLPNVTEAILIIGLWYAMWLRKEKWQKTMAKTGICLGGYIAGVLIPFVAVHIQYGPRAFLDMLSGLSSVTQVDDTYTPLSMITSVIDAYARSFMWIAVIFVGILLGVAMFATYKEKYLVVKKIIYFGGIALVLRFFWGRGMFTFRYYEDYTSMFEWGMVGLYLSLIICIVIMVQSRFRMQEKVMAMMVFLVIVVTPLGSNNYTCQNLNNLFVVAPFVVHMYRIVFKSSKSVLAYPVKAFVAIIAGAILIQTIGFHTNFIFRDGMDGQKRNTAVEGSLTADGTYTTKENALSFQSLAAFCKEEGLTGEEMLCYGNAPGLTFLLKMPFAISTSWPDLDSYALSQLEEELAKREGKIPVIIVSNKQDVSEMAEKKRQYIMSYIAEKNYQTVFDNGMYCVYR